MQQFKNDTLIDVEAYHIDDYKSSPRPYEKHHKNSGVKVSALNQKIRFLKGDYIIWLNQPANRYLVEMLEPTGDDSFFAWNFFAASAPAQLDFIYKNSPYYEPVHNRYPVYRLKTK